MGSSGNALGAKKRKGGKRSLEEGVVSDDDDKLDKFKAQEESAGESACMTRLFMIFVSVVCIAFLDMAFAHERLYKEVFFVPSQPAVSKAMAISNKKHRTNIIPTVEEDIIKTDLLLARTGAINKPHVDFEKERIQEVLSGGELRDWESQPGDSDKDPDEKPRDLIKTKEEVLSLNKKVNSRITRRIAKHSAGQLVMSLGGYDLGSTGLTAGGEKIHGNKELIDFFALAESRGALVQKKMEEAEHAAESSDDETDSSSTSEGSDSPHAAGNHRSRKEVFELREPDPDFAKFVQELRSDATYAHVHKKNDMERALKSLGYKQSTKSSKKVPLIVGDENKCPSQFKMDEQRISFCPLFFPVNKADQYYHIQQFAERVPESKLKPDFYPLTWRLYRLEERAKLKEHCTNDTMTEFGVAYVRKFTVPGENYMKSADSIYEQLEKSEKSVKQLRKETKNRAVVQLYINNPLLIEERKFIIRTYAVIVSTKPLIVYYSDGAGLRSVIKYQPFSRHDSDYKKAAHITSEQKTANKKVLKSSELYMSFHSLQTYLTEAGNDPNYVTKVLRPHMKARMIYALHAIIQRQRGGEDETEEEQIDRAQSLPRSTAIVQEACFDFLLDESKKLWLITVGTGSHCFVTMGGSSFRPSWKGKLQNALSESTAQLAEEMLWRRSNDMPISSMDFYTQTGMTVLIDETFPDWDVTKEINNHMDGIQVAQDNHDYVSEDAEEGENGNDSGSDSVFEPASDDGNDSDSDNGDNDNDSEEDD